MADMAISTNSWNSSLIDYNNIIVFTAFSMITFTHNNRWWLSRPSSGKMIKIQYANKNFRPCSLHH